MYHDTEYGRVLNMQKLHRVLNIAQYGWICLNRTWIRLNMSEYFDNRQGSEYVSCNTWREATLQADEHLLRDRRIQNPGVLWKNSYSFNYFCQKLLLKFLRGFLNWIGFKYVRVLNHCVKSTEPKYCVFSGLYFPVRRFNP